MALGLERLRQRVTPPGPHDLTNKKYFQILLDIASGCDIMGGRKVGQTDELERAERPGPGAQT